MGKRALTLVAATFILVAEVAFAQTPPPPDITVTTDRKPLVQGEPFVLTIHVVAHVGEPEIKLPLLTGFEVLQQSESHPVSMSFSFNMGSGGTRHVKKESVYRYKLRANNPGKYKLAPVEVVQDGRRHKGKGYLLQVLPSGTGGGVPPSGGVTGAAQRDPASASPPPPQGRPSAPAVLNPGDIKGARYDKKYFVQTVVSKEQAVIGEPVVMSVYFYTSVNVGRPAVMREPGTEGFWVENLLSPNQRHPVDSVIINGTEFAKVLVRKVVLFPIDPGKRTIAPAIVEVRVRTGFLSTRKVKRAALPVQVEVAPLPDENQPDGFNPANVGELSFDAVVDRTNVKVGEPIILTLKAAGAGNIRNIELPGYDGLEGFKVYAPETETEVSVRPETVEGYKSTQTLMIPKKPGEYVVQAIPWSFFDLGSKEYKEVSSRAIKLTVEGAAEVEASPTKVAVAPTVSKAGQDRLNRKLKSIASRADLSVEKEKPLLARAWYLAVAIATPLLYIGLLVTLRTRRKMAADSSKGRAKRAHSRASKSLVELEKFMGAKSAEDFFAGLSRVLLTFLGDRLEVPVAGDTASELKERLIARGFSAETAEKVVMELEACDFARFARGQGRDAERRQALERMASLLKELNGVKVMAKQEVKR